MHLRTRLLAAVTLAVLLAVGGLIFAYNLLLSSQLSDDANDVLKARAAAEISSLERHDGRLVAPEAPDSAELDSVTWVFAGTRTLEAPRARRSTQLAARSLAGGPRRTLDLDREDVRLYAVPVRGGAQRLGTVVSGVSLAPYERTQHVALVASLILAGVLLVVVLLLARWMVTLALRPVERMTSQAADWSEHDLDRRFALGPPHDELTKLGATLDGLLARISASLRHEQRFSAEISHELRTPLAKIKAEGELALKHDAEDGGHREAVESMLRSADQIGRTVDALIAAAREEAGTSRGVSDAYETAVLARETCSQLAQREHVELSVDRPDAPVTVAIDPDLLERVLVPLLENACRYGRSTASVRISTEDSAVYFEVTDDGPGVTAEELQRIFDPGVQGTAATQEGQGAGLGLALARRLARAAGGEVHAIAGDTGRFYVRLPSI
jgi:two-component system OmpR family sensor kinase